MREIYLLIILLVLLLGSSNNAFSQNQFDFNKKTISDKIQQDAGDDYKFVSFMIAGVNNEVTADAFLKKMEQQYSLKTYQLTGIGKFSGFIKTDISADQMREFLLESNYDFNFSTVQVLDKNIKQQICNSEKEENKTELTDKPVFIDTGNPEADKAKYIEEKNIWIENNPSYNE